MYGLVNRAVQGLVESTWGPEVWTRVCKDAGVSPTGFQAMQAYPDQLTYALVDAASRHSGQSSDRILRALGTYWVLYTGREGYGELLSTSGSSLEAFLANLDHLHDRVAATFSELAPPSFRVEPVEPGCLRLHYYSGRPGLSPMVVGLLEGLGTMFATPVSIEIEGLREDGHDHDIFLVRYG